MKLSLATRLELHMALCAETRAKSARFGCSECPRPFDRKCDMFKRCTIRQTMWQTKKRKTQGSISEELVRQDLEDFLL